MRRRTFLGSGLALAALSRSGVAGEDRRDLLVVNSVQSTLDFLDGRTFARVGRVPLDPRPREIALSPDGGMAYVAIYGPGIYGNNPSPGRSILAIDPATRKVVKTIGLGPHVGPHAMAVSPDGRIWTTCETEGTLLLVDPAAKSRSTAIPAVVPLGAKGAHWLALTADGQKLYAASGAHPVLSVVSAPDRRLVREIKVTGGLGALAIAADGRRLFAASLDRASLWIIDTREDRIVREFRLDEPASRLLALPDGGGLVLAHEASGTIEVLDIPSLRRRGMLRVGRSPSGLVATPDGRTAYVASWAEGKITQVDLGSLRALRTIDGGTGPDGLALARSA